MSYPTWKSLFAFAAIIPLGTLALSPSSAFAGGHGGFGGHGFGGHGFGLGFGLASGPAYVEPAPTYAFVSERHRHHNSHGAESSPKARVVTRAMKPTPAVMPTPDAGEADLRKCLTKEYLPDRSVVFKDSCTKESASTARSAPAMNDFSPPPKVSQSIRLEPLMANDDVPQQMDGP